MKLLGFNCTVNFPYLKKKLLQLKGFNENQRGFLPFREHNHAKTIKNDIVHSSEWFFL